jgi:hypothetical protein
MIKRAQANNRLQLTALRAAAEPERLLFQQPVLLCEQ